MQYRYRCIAILIIPQRLSLLSALRGKCLYSAIIILTEGYDVRNGGVMAEYGTVRGRL